MPNDNDRTKLKRVLKWISDGSSEIIGCREFSIHQGMHIGTVKIYQDNISVINLLENLPPIERDI